MMRRYLLVFLGVGLTSLQLLAQKSYPVKATLLVKAPHSPYVSDYTTVDNNPLTLTLLNQDASFSGEVVFRLSMKGVGISIQSTNPGTIPVSTPLAVPVLLSGSDLASYFSSSNLSFSGYSKTQYDQKGTLPEGLYEFSFQAFDAKRNDIAVSNVASFMCWIQLHDPPQLIFPKNQSTAESKTPQQVSFQWQGTTLTNVTYELELYELRVTDKRDPNEVIRGASPIFTTTTKASTYIYTIKDPPLQDGLNYAWRVRAKTDTDKELIKNGGYSSTFTFTYLPTCKTPSLVKSLPSKNKTALISWAGEGKEYVIQYREQEETGLNDWYEELSLTESLTITQLRPGRRYEYRIKSICEYNYSAYTKIDTFSIPHATTSTPLKPPAGGYPAFNLDKSTYLEEAPEGMMIKVNHFEMKIIKAVKNEQTKLWTGTGTMYFPSLKANVLMEFKDIHINKDQRLVAGHIYGVRAPKPMTKVKLPPVKKAKKICLTYGPDGYDEEGYDKDGYDRAGYNKEGRDKEGYDKLGYNAQNLDRNGKPKQTPPTQGNPTASTGANTNGNNTTQTGTSGSTSGQGGSGGNTTTTGTNGNSGGATPTTSVEEDAFTLELVSYYEQMIVAYLTEHPEIKGSGPEPWYGGNTTQLPPCLEDHKEDIEYIRQYLSVSKNDKAKRAELIQKMKSNDSFMGFFSQAITEKKKTGNETKTYKELLSNTDWIKLAEKTCNEIYQVAGEYYIKTIVSDLVSSECASRAAQKAINRFNPLKLYSYGTATLAAITEAWLCATEQDKCKGKDYWTQYSYGIIHGIIEQADLLAITDLLEDLIQSQYQNRLSCLGKENDIKIRATAEGNVEETIHILLKCGLGIDVTLTELNQRYTLTKSYIEKNWQEPYFRGEATVLISTLIVPTAKGISLIRKGILAKFRKAATFSKEIQTLEALSAAEGKVDEIAKVMKATKAGSYLENLARYKQLFKEGKIAELFSELKKTTAFPKMGNTRVRNQADLLAEYKAKYGQNATNYPYSITNSVTDFELAETGYFVRVFSGESKNSSWVFRIEDLKQYNSVDEILEKLALPNKPTKVGLVELPEGVKLRKSVAGPQNWSNGITPEGGGIQYEILGERSNDWFSKESLDLENIFK